MNISRRGDQWNRKRKSSWKRRGAVEIERLRVVIETTTLSSIQSNKRGRLATLVTDRKTRRRPEEKKTRRKTRRRRVVEKQMMKSRTYSNYSRVEIQKQKTTCNVVQYCSKRHLFFTSRLFCHSSIMVVRLFYSLDQKHSLIYLLFLLSITTTLSTRLSIRHSHIMKTSLKIILISSLHSLTSLQTYTLQKYSTFS